MKNLIFYFLLIIASSFQIFSQSGWIPQNSGTTSNLGYVDFINDNSGFAGNPFLKTINGGQNWNIIPGGPTAFQTISFVNANTGYGGTGVLTFGTIYKTIDGGYNWAAIGGYRKYLVDFISPDSGMAAGGDQPYAINTGLFFYKTTNGGITWDSILFPNIAINTGIYNDWFTSLHIFNASNAYVVQHAENEEEEPNTRVWKSTNFGNNWFGVHDIDSMEIYSLQYASLDTGYCIGRENTLNNIMPWLDYIYKIVNNNYTVVYTANENVNLLGLDFVSSSTGFVCGSNGLILKTTNSGLNWYTLNSGTNAHLRMVQFTNSNTGYIVGDNGTILKTTTGGEPLALHSISGNVRFQDNNDPVTSGYVKAVRYDSATYSIITVDSAQIQSNGAYTLTNCPPITLDIMAYENDEEDLYFVPTYYVSTIYWENAVHVKPDSNLTSINIAVKRTVNSGGSMYISGYVYSSNLDNTALNNAIIYSRSSGMFRGHSISITNGYYKVDSLPAGVYELIADRMGYSGDSYVISLTNSGMDNVNFYLDNVLVPVNPEGVNVPEKYWLSQNYPNPFNPATEIKFGLPEESYVSLVIYDLLGREIDVLVRENLKGGEYKVKWNASNYSSGIYFYQLQSKSFTETKKLVLIK